MAPATLRPGWHDASSHSKSILLLATLVLVTESQRDFVVQRIWHRAKRLSTCISETRVDDRKQNKRFPEVLLCKPIKTAYVHVYKAAGTSLNGAFGSLCNKQFGKNSSVFLLDTKPEADWTLFTFMRGVFQRTVSSMGEALLRNDPHVLRLWRSSHHQPGAFMESVISDCISKKHIQSEITCDAHLTPQLSFVTENGVLLPGMTYVGRVENILAEFPALMSILFNTSFTLASSGLKHARNNDDPAYVANRTISSVFRTRVHELPELPGSIKAMMIQAYLYDYVCIDLVE